jgi:uncharacterized protein with von Willebrand factor type A (vWA) domain
MMSSSNDLRRSVNFLLDKIEELEAAISELERNKTDQKKRGFFEWLILKAGEAIKRTQIKSPLFKEFRDLGNGIRHKLDTDLDNTINSIRINLPKLKAYAESTFQNVLSANTALKAFEKFGDIGTQNERAKLIDALLDKLTEKDKSNWGRFPSNPIFKNFTLQVDEIISHADLLKLTQENQTIATQVTEDITSWARDLQKQLLTRNPFSDEEKVFIDTKQLSHQDFFTNYERISDYLNSIYKNGEINFAFFDKKLKKLDKRLDLERIIKGELKEISKGRIDLKDGIEKFIESKEFKKFEKHLPFNKRNYTEYAENKARDILREAEALHINFLKDWETQLFEKKRKGELDAIDQAKRLFMEKLYKKVSEFNYLKELLEPFTRDLGRLWDLSSGAWRNSGFELIKKYAEILENDKAIKALAALLGRYRKTEMEFEEVEIEKIIVKPKFRLRHATKGEVIGIRESDNISSMLPIEAATLLNPATKAIFLKKFAEKKLATYDFRNQLGDTEKLTIKERQLREKENEKGPIIICVDTSGSMQGIPEQVAKTICFALTRIALRENRKCFLISFSTKIQTTELTDLQNSLNKLIEFLGMSFNGGTEANPALLKSLEMLESSEYNKADVLMISDFVMGELDKSTVVKIETAKSKKTKFHGLTISSSANLNVIKEFSNNWVYNTKGNNQSELLIKQLKSI